MARMKNALLDSGQNRGGNNPARSTDRTNVSRELQLEDSCRIDPYDIHDHDFDEEPEWVDYEAPYRTETPHA